MVFIFRYWIPLKRGTCRVSRFEPPIFPPQEIKMLEMPAFNFCLARLVCLSLINITCSHLLRMSVQEFHTSLFFFKFHEYFFTICFSVQCWVSAFEIFETSEYSKASFCYLKAFSKVEASRKRALSVRYFGKKRNKIILFPIYYLDESSLVLWSWMHAFFTFLTLTELFINEQLSKAE